MGKFTGIACFQYILLLTLSGIAPAGVADQLSLERSAVLARSGFAKTLDLAMTPAAGSGVVFQHQFSGNDARYMRFRFQIPRVGNPCSGWRIQVQRRLSGGEFEPVWTLDAKAVKENSVWSGPVTGEAVKVQLIVDDPTIKPVISIDRMAVAQSESVPKSIVGADERQSINDFPGTVSELGKAVAKIVFVSDGGKIYSCTGFLVTDELLLTNEHCISTESERRSAYVFFDYNKDPEPAAFLTLSELVHHDYDLDFSLVRLEQTTGRTPLALSASGIDANEKLLVIQHPGGEPKQVSQRGCVVDKVSISGRGNTTTDFSHGCDTLGGSSGAPVIRRSTSEVVGLHHLGFEKNTSRLLNRAVHVQHILENLDKHQVILPL